MSRESFSTGHVSASQAGGTPTQAETTFHSDACSVANVAHDGVVLVIANPLASCVVCGVGRIGSKCWARMNRAQRAEARRQGWAESRGRGLCGACYARARYRGTLGVPDRHNRPADELLDDWVMLRDDGYTIRNAAPRLGVTSGALDKALQRAKKRGDVRGERTPFGRQRSA